MSMFFLEDDDDDLGTAKGIFPLDDWDVKHNHAFKAKRVKNKKFLIKLFHGANPAIISKVTTAFGPNSKDDYEWQFEGTLDDVAEKLGDKFIYIPGPSVDAHNIIYVTQAASFNSVTSR